MAKFRLINSFGQSNKSKANKILSDSRLDFFIKKKIDPLPGENRIKLLRRNFAKIPFNLFIYLIIICLIFIRYFDELLNEGKTEKPIIH